MKIKKISIFLFVVLFFSGIFIFQSCRNNFTLEEIDKTKGLNLNGNVAAPILAETKLSLGNFMPESVGDFWFETDEDGMIHVRMYQSNIQTVIASDIWDANIPYLPADSIYVNADPMSLGMFNNALSGQLYAANPKLNIILKNQIPMDLYIRLDTIQFFNINNQIITESTVSEYFDFYNSGAGGTYIDTFVIDTTLIPGLGNLFAGTIDEIPSTISFAAQVGNYEGDSLSITGNEELNIDLDIDLPLEIKLRDFILSDTTDMDWGNDLYDEIDSIVLRINISNGFPFEGLIQIDFMDTDEYGVPENVIHSLFDENNNDVPAEYETWWKLESPEIDDLGYTQNPTDSRMEIAISKSKIDELRTAKADKLVIRSALNTSEVPGNNDYIRMQLSDNIAVSISFMLAGNIIID